MNKGRLLQAYGVLAGASLEKVEVKDRIMIIKLLRSVRTEAEELQDFINEVREKNQAILEQNADRQAIAEIVKTINEESEKEIEAKDINIITTATFEKLIESNPRWTPAAMMAVEDVFVAQ